MDYNSPLSHWVLCNWTEDWGAGAVPVPKEFAMYGRVGGQAKYVKQRQNSVRALIGKGEIRGQKVMTCVHKNIKDIANPE